MQYPVIEVSPNIRLSTDEAFCVFNVYIVKEILSYVDMTFSDALQIPCSSIDKCTVRYNYFKDNPMCSNIGNDRIIYLHTRGDFWCQWIYQFAHEYCHHIINGTMTGELSGLMWFEESVCELASMYNLNSLFRIWSQYPQSVQRHYAPSFQDYLNDLLAENPELYASTLHPKFLQSWDSLLRENVYHRDHYNAIAARMFPLFLENPYLWKMILHIGDSRQWNSLEELFAHLERNADDSYSDSLIQLKNLLIP